MWNRGAWALLSLASLIGAAALAAGSSGTRASNGGMDAMSIDLDASGNTATTLGPLDGCQEVHPGQIVTLDVTATNIPASNPIIGFEYSVLYNDSVLAIETQDHQFLLAATPGSALFNASKPTPDTDESNDWYGGVGDLSTTEAESGSGTLSRLSLSVGPGMSPGLYNLTLDPALATHVDSQGNAYVPSVLNAASIAVGVTCPPPPSMTPPPSAPVPTATPGPTPIPTPNPLSMSVAYQEDARISVRDNTVTLRGTLNCSVPATVIVQMLVIEYSAGHTVAAPAGALLECDGAVNWVLTGEAVGGRLKPGYAQVVVHAETHDYGVQAVGASGQIRLKGGR